MRPPLSLRLAFVVYLLSLRTGAAQAQWPALLQAGARTSAVTGREAEATRFVQSLFKPGALQHDALGNLVLVLGSG